MRLRTRTAAVASAAAVGVAALGGAALATGTIVAGGDDDLRQPGTITVDESTLPQDDVAERDALAALATVDQAAAEAAAVELVSGGQALRAELEEEDGFVVWEVVVRAGDGTVQEVTVDAGDAGVLGTEREDDEDDGDDLRQPGTVPVEESTLPDDDAAEQEALTALATVEQAAAGEAALQAVGGGEVVQAELEETDGFVVWEVLVRTGDGTLQEVTVDAGNSSILATELDDDEHDEDAAEDDD